ncbi:GNAT family N-acetyltransferase [Geothrix terrae]|uniref:GNAT family N-acetyltransferase n=1 Tax=Geothrix terrae TaxID=2922720 RepID=UPI001FADAE09|nr:GNAT family N-acetyltransferase [Geothrix terrae]
MSHRIRSANLSDASEIARLSDALGYPAGREEIVRRLALLLPNPSHLVLVAEPLEGHGLLGWLAAERRITLESGIKFEIVGLVVDGTVRRSGIGKALVRAAEAWVLDQSGASLGVRSNVLRPESHGFYESLGYLRKKSQHVYHKSLSA